MAESLAGSRVVQKALMRPVRLVPLAFLAVITVGTLLLLLPWAHAGEGSATLVAAAFTAVSATCVTGLTAVDTATYWTTFGHAVMVLLTQVGGFGIMSAATLLAFIVRGKMDLSGSLVAQTEKQTSGLGDVSSILIRIGLAMGITEGIVWVLLTVRFLMRGMAPLEAIWQGLFYACCAFTNAGFTLTTDSLMGYVVDPFLMWPIFLAVFMGSLGYPVLFELGKSWRTPRVWSVHTRITFWGWVALALVGFFAFIAFEWTNPHTLGPMSVATKVTAATSGAIMPRSGGFNAVDYSLIKEESVVVTIILMFSGGGSAGTSGGLKVSTFFLLAFVILAEIRGEPEVTVAHRSIGVVTQRRAVTVALLSVGLVTLATIVLVIMTDLPLVAVVFDVVSAFGTVGLSLGVTPELPPAGQVILMVLMFVGRVGTVTAASAFALRTRRRHYSLPEERPIVG